MTPQLSRLIMPDIVMPFSSVSDATKYDIRPTENMMKVSLTTDRVRKRSDLKARVDTKPKKPPIRIEIAPTIANC